MNHLAIVIMSISEIDISLEDIVDILAVTGTLYRQYSWLPNLIMEVP